MTRTPDEHGAAMKEFLNDWTPLTSEDRAAAMQDAPGVLFLDGDSYAQRATATVDAELASDDATTFEATIGAVRRASAVAIERGGETCYRSETPVGDSVTLDRVDGTSAYTVRVQHSETGEWRDTARIGVKRNPKKPLPDGRYYGAVVTQGGDEEEAFGRKTVAKYRHDAIKSWTNARYIVVADATRKDAIPEEVLLNPTEQDYDLWFNAFYTDYTAIGWSVLDAVLRPNSYRPLNKPYAVICAS